MGAFSRSWNITKLSFSVIGKDKEMLLFPLIASIASIAYMVALIVPSGVLSFFGSNAESEVALGMLQYTLLFLTYLGLAFIATFFNVCVVYTTKTRFEGGDATFMDSIKFAMSKLGIILQWSLVAATVGLFLAALDHIAERMGGVGEIILKIVRGLLGMVWSIVTIFVVPTLVYEDVSPKEAIRRSTEVIKETWGENLIKHFGLGLIQFLCIFLTIAICGGLAVVLPPGIATIVVACVAVIGTLGIVLVFNVATTVFNTALYAYASTGVEPEMFRGTDNSLSQAFRIR